ncbi:hypothetical protein Tco_0145846 [Tanacetum coccineum]
MTPEEEPEEDDEDPEEDPADYPADGEDDDERNEDEDEGEERHPAPADLSTCTLRTARIAGCILLLPPLVMRSGRGSAADAARQDRPTIARDDPYSIAREELYGFFNMVDVPPRCSTSRELDYGITDT